MEGCRAVGFDDGGEGGTGDGGDGFLEIGCGAGCCCDLGGLGELMCEGEAETYVDFFGVSVKFDALDVNSCLDKNIWICA